LCTRLTLQGDKQGNSYQGVWCYYSGIKDSLTQVNCDGVFLKLLDYSNHVLKFYHNIMSMNSVIDSKEELRKFTEQYIVPQEHDKKKLAAVFTPEILAVEMLDKIPGYIWENKNLKWLESSNGVGHFSLQVYHRLYSSLKEEIPNNVERKKHIFENMLYFVEINKEYNDIFKSVVGNDFKLNLYEGDFLSFNSKKEMNVLSFDIIYGNPPYQRENKKSGVARGGKGNLYIDFVKKSLELLSTNGHLLFIHPPNWRKIGSQIFKEFLTRDLIYLSINYGGKFFKSVSVKTDFYLLRNSKSGIETQVEYFFNKKKHVNKLTVGERITFIPNIF